MAIRTHKRTSYAQALPMRNDLHLMRKIWHMVMGLTIVTLYVAGFPKPLALLILGSLLVFSVLMELARLKNPVMNERCVRFFGYLMRTNEVNEISGMPYYIASAFFAIAVFPIHVAMLSLLYLALGDPIASFFGILYRGRSISLRQGKSFHGTVAGFLACAAATWIYLGAVGMGGLNHIRLTLLGGFAGAIAELLPLEIDDNFTIPVVSGLIMWLGFVAIHFV